VKGISDFWFAKVKFPHRKRLDKTPIEFLAQRTASVVR
jgi:hypothetical protein